jgi:hypothetical protein
MILRSTCLLLLALCSRHALAQLDQNRAPDSRTSFITGRSDVESKATELLKTSPQDPQADSVRTELPNAPSQSNAATKVDDPVSQSHESTLYVRDIAIDSHKKPRTIDSQFLLLNALQVIAAVADAETTLSCVSSPRCSEVNPILGDHPTRGRMYALAVPLTSLSVYLSYHYKRQSPSRDWWKVYPLTLSVIHAVGAVANSH